jgi:hypothetical protein
MRRRTGVVGTAGRILLGHGFRHTQLALSPTVPCSRQPDGLPAPSSEVMRRAILGGGAPASQAWWPPHLRREVGVQRLVDVESLTCASGRKRGRLRHHRRALPLAPKIREDEGKLSSLDPAAIDELRRSTWPPPGWPAAGCNTPVWPPSPAARSGTKLEP